MPPLRIISRLDIKGPNVVKGVHLEGLRVVGHPGEMARRYYEQGIDEIIYMDIVASLYGRNNILSIVREATRDVFVPLTVGGGLRSIDDIVEALRSGADKVAINTAAIRRPDLIAEAGRAFGSQCIVVSIEAKRWPDGRPGWEALTDNGRERTGIDAVAWAEQAQRLGAGELLVTSVDREGTARGFDLELLSEIHARVRIPVIASGGCGGPDHAAAVATRHCADAIACAHIFQYEICPVPQLKSELQRAGIEVRRCV
ncbi:MAG: imidazole glycerol phosphate synthase subunit HisF [Alphaproteobacteria bacterium]|nr:imidazole glycerol phosphate synthase subunit HisF [Alphaproteobacteria bacterium]